MTFLKNNNKTELSDTLYRWSILFLYAMVAAYLLNYIDNILTPSSIRYIPIQSMSLFGLDWNNFGLTQTVMILTFSMVGWVQALLVRWIIKKFHLKVQTHQQGNVNWKKERSNPSIFFAVLLGLLFLIIISGPIQIAGKFLYTPVGISLLSIGITWLYWHLRWSSIDLAIEDVSYPLPISQLKTSNLEKWLQDESPSIDVDYFDRIDKYAKRINDRLENSSRYTRGQVIVGDQGSGKSTIIEIIKTMLDKDWITVTYGAWGTATEKTTLIELILNSAIKNVGDQLEVTRLLSLPEDYLKAAYSAKRPLALLQLFKPDLTPKEILEKLNNLLLINSKKLLIIVEDLDRCEDEAKSVNHLAGFMDRLNGMDRIQFIFTTSPGSESTSDILRVSDYREDIESIDPDPVLQCFYKLCMEKAEDEYILYQGDNKEHWLFKGNEVHHGVRSSLTIDEAPYKAMSSHLTNPRKLKATLRRVLEIWKKVKGEINLNDLMVYNTLRNSPELIDVLDWFHKPLNRVRRLENLKLKNPKDIEIESAPKNPLLTYLDGVGAVKPNSLDIQGVRRLKSDISSKRYHHILLTESLPEEAGWSDQLVYKKLSDFYFDAMNKNAQWDYVQTLLTNHSVLERSYYFLRFLDVYNESETCKDMVMSFVARLCQNIKFMFSYESRNIGTHNSFTNSEIVEAVISGEFEFGSWISIHNQQMENVRYLISDLSCEQMDIQSGVLSDVFTKAFESNVYQGLYLSWLLFEQAESGFSKPIYEEMLSGVLLGINGQSDLLSALGHGINKRLHGFLVPFTNKNLAPMCKVLADCMNQSPRDRKIDGLRVFTAIIREGLKMKQDEVVNLKKYSHESLYSSTDRFLIHSTQFEKIITSWDQISEEDWKAIPTDEHEDMNAILLSIAHNKKMRPVKAEEFKRSLLEPTNTPAVLDFDING